LCYEVASENIVTDIFTNIYNSSLSNTTEFCEDMSVYNNVTPVFLSIYLITANVMLLNLLIAVFTSVFEEVHQNSKEVWKWEMYTLVEEYDHKPGLAPPFVILEDLWKMLKGIWKKTCRSKRENLDLYMQDTLEALELFEKDCLNEFLHDQVQNENSKMENKMEKVEGRLNKLLELMENTAESHSSWDWGEHIHTIQHSSDSSSDEDRIINDHFIGNRAKSKNTKANSKKSVKFGEVDKW